MKKWETSRREDILKDKAGSTYRDTHTNTQNEAFLPLMDVKDEKQGHNLSGPGCCLDSDPPYPLTN